MPGTFKIHWRGFSVVSIALITNELDFFSPCTSTTPLFTAQRAAQRRSFYFLFLLHHFFNDTRQQSCPLICTTIGSHQIRSARAVSLSRVSVNIHELDRCSYLDAMRSRARSSIGRCMWRGGGGAWWGEVSTEPNTGLESWWCGQHWHRLRHRHQ